MKYLKSGTWYIHLMCLLMLYASYHGLFVNGFYSQETLILDGFTRAADFAVFFFIVPFSLINSYFIFKKHYMGLMNWLALLAIIIYNYGFNAFNLHFNRLFVIYVVLFGMAVYGFVYWMIAAFTEQKVFNRVFVGKKTPIMIFLIGLSATFYVIWLKDIVSAIVQGTVPEVIINWNVLTSAVHVIDMALLLPLCIISAYLLYKRNSGGNIVLAGSMLLFLTMLALILVVSYLYLMSDGFNRDMVKFVIYCVITAVGSGLYVYFIKHLRSAQNET